MCPSAAVRLGWELSEMNVELNEGLFQLLW